MDKDTTQQFTHEQIMEALREHREATERIEKKLDLLLAILAPVKKAVSYFVSVWKTENS